MSEETIKFTYHNQQSNTVELIIEPWGLIEEVPADSAITFEINVAPPPEIEFSVTEEGQPYVFVMSEQVRIWLDGVLKHEFTTSIRPPEGTFRTMNKLFFSKFPETKARKP